MRYLQYRVSVSSEAPVANSLAWQFRSRVGYRPFEDLQRFVARHGIRVLNVAGSSESKEPGIWLWTFETLEAAFFRDKAHPSSLGGPGEG